jgi:hypothetical protein
VEEEGALIKEKLSNWMGIGWFLSRSTLNQRLGHLSGLIYFALGRIYWMLHFATGETDV